MHKPSPATVIALVALFVALGGVGVAATGGNLILGQPNSADKTTALNVSTLPGGTACPAPCQALQVTDSSVASNAGGLGVLGKSPSTPATTIKNTGGATALDLLVNSGKPPLAVNSSAKVASLNADLLDGKDSTAFLRSSGTVVLSYAVLNAVPQTPTLTVSPWVGSTLRVTTSAAGAYWVILPVDLPVGIFGKRLNVKSAQICYETAGGSAITGTALRDDGVGGELNSYVDSTTRTGSNTCYTVGPSSPWKMLGGFAVMVELNFTTTSDVVILYPGRLTLTT